MKYTSLAILLLCAGLLCVGHGLHGSLVAISASKADFRSDTTGLIMSGYAAGMLFSALYTPKLVAKVGHVRVFAAFASVVSTVVLLIPLWVNPVFWFGLRFIAGFGTSGLYLVCESWLNSFASNQSRGRVLSFYMIVTYGGLGIGQLMLNVQDESGFARFILVSALLSLSLVPLILLPTEAPDVTDAKPVDLQRIWHASPLALVGAIANGMGQSAFFAMGSLFGLGKGLSVTGVSLMLAMPSICVIFSQFPIGWLSDKIDRRRIIMILSACGAVIPALLLYFWFARSYVLISSIALFGALIIPLYSLVIAHANDHLRRDEILGASGRLVLLYGVGSVLGPTVCGRVMYAFGPAGFLYFQIAVFGSLALFAAWRAYQSPETLPAGSLDALQVAPLSTPTGAQALARTE